MKYNEKELENTIIQLLEEKGYTYIKETDNWIVNRKLDEYINEEDLLTALDIINNGTNKNIFNEVISKIKNLESLSFVEKNKLFHKYLIDGIIIEDHSAKSNPLIKIIDFEVVSNNIFKVANQIKFNEGKNTRIPDIIIYINGMPLIVFELKSIEEREDATIEHAYEQLGGNSSNDGYRYDIPTLFNYNALCIISDGANNRVGTITSNFERYNEWKSIDGIDIYNEDSVKKLDYLIDGVLEPTRLLDIIKNNLFYINKYKEKPIKILSGYHQYFGVNIAYKSIKNHIKPNGDGKAGIIWHTQGSGKSFSMLMLAYRLIQDKKLENPTIVVLTDRNDLDDQLYTTFSSAKDFLRTEPVK